MVQEVQRKEEEGAVEGREKWRQNISSLSVLTVAVLVGLPLWWKTTEVYRSPLPYSDIQNLAGQQAPPSLVYTISVLVLTEEETMAASFLSNLQTELANHTGGWVVFLQ
ncbi:GPI transamidase component PIG-S [Geodia barretti]|uniref:GPI transamidase component PIG-S n=1 Tax=Geodia barretti TaxID=519541 RepID=A0AA35THK7_GEOBA|nr:GPI transamidase component PIG-S [Geodia barretti]